MRIAVNKIDARNDEERRRAAIALVEAWQNADDEDSKEQKETYAYLEQALNESRLSDRKRL